MKTFDPNQLGAKPLGVKLENDCQNHPRPICYIDKYECLFVTRLLLWLDLSKNPIVPTVFKYIKKGVCVKESTLCLVQLDASKL